MVFFAAHAAKVPAAALPKRFLQRLPIPPGPMALRRFFSLIPLCVFVPALNLSVIFSALVMTFSLVYNHPVPQDLSHCLSISLQWD